jgi:NADPH:quinone reductase-like Zn-dependent oxidoreductase
VKQLSVGDRVLMIGADYFATTAVTIQEYCEKIPDTLTFEDAATMPAVFATTIYSLIHIGRMEKGQVRRVH